ncbi:MAG: hypothetical protein IPL39_20155 [Opitutaceae bacterium]|nr:hypothetical protein [Opitutaceae bacterium]
MGTFLTNNVPGHKALSQVIKLSAVNGQPVAKISDEPEKATCDNPEYAASAEGNLRHRLTPPQSP